MSALETTDPVIQQVVMDRNSTVNKNKMPFCAIRGNRITKVTGGLVGITQNVYRSWNIFSWGPSRLAEDAKQDGLGLKRW